MQNPSLGSIEMRDERSGLVQMIMVMAILVGAVFATERIATTGTFHTQNIVVDDKVQLGSIAPSASQRVFLDDNSATDTTIFWTQSDSIHHVGTGGNNEMIHFVSRMNDTFDTTAGAANGAIHDEIANCGVDTGVNDVTCSVHNVNAFCTTAHCTAYVWNSQNGILRHDDRVSFGGAGGTAPVSLGNGVTRFTVMPESPTTTIPQLDVGIQAPVDSFAIHTKRTDSGGSLSGILVELDTTLAAGARGGFVISRGAGGGAAGNNSGVVVSGGPGYPFTGSVAGDLALYAEQNGIEFGADASGFTMATRLTSSNHWVQETSTGAPGLDAGCTSGGGSAIIGNDNRFEVTTGATSTACTVTFHSTWTSKPICQITTEGGIALPTYTVSATAVTITVNLNAGVYNVDCQGQPGST